MEVKCLRDVEDIENFIVISKLEDLRKFEIGYNITKNEEYSYLYLYSINTHLKFLEIIDTNKDIAILYDKQDGFEWCQQYKIYISSEKKEVILLLS